MIFPLDAELLSPDAVLRAAVILIVRRPQKPHKHWSVDTPTLPDDF
jgi:hypothetical protein